MAFLRKKWFGAGALLVLLCLVLYLPGQMTLPPFDRDEARFAQASRQMIETGDYVDISFQDQTRYKKPVGIYWLQALSAKALDAKDAIWAYRVPSWVGATIAVCATAFIGALLISPLAGLLAGIVLASTLLLGVEARLAKTDAALLACVVLAQMVLARLWIAAKTGARTGCQTDVQADVQADAQTGGQAEAQSPVRRRSILLFWIVLGVGVLIKGPIVPMVSGLTALVLSVGSRSVKWLAPLKSSEGFALCLAIILPWLVVISIKTQGAFWVDSVGKDLMAKAASGQEGHGAPPGYYLLTFFLTFWPWSILAIPAAWHAWQRRREAIVQFLAAWIIPTWIVFELIPTKLLHYTLPTFPAIALLVGMALVTRWERMHNKEAGGKHLSPRTDFVLVVAGGVLLAFVALGVPLTPFLGFGDALSIAGLSAGVLLVAVGLAAWRLLYSQPILGAGLFLLGVVNFYATAFGQTLVSFESFWVSRSAAALVAPHRDNCPGSVTSIGYHEPSLVFLLGTETRLAPSFPTDVGCHLVMVEKNAGTSIPDGAERLGSTSGFNYSKGDDVTLVLYRLVNKPVYLPFPLPPPEEGTGADTETKGAGSTEGGQNTGSQNQSRNQSENQSQNTEGSKQQ